MIEYTEAYIISNQINKYLVNKKIIKVSLNPKRSKFTWVYNDGLNYNTKLLNDYIIKSTHYGNIIDITLSNNKIFISDGVKIQYLKEEASNKYPLVITFEDNTYLVFSIIMYGGIWIKHNNENYLFDNWVHNHLNNALLKPDILSDEFNLDYFNNILNQNNTKSLKYTLATNGIIPGIGNGLLNEILYQAKLFHKTKVNLLSEIEINTLFYSIKQVIKNIINNLGRDSETYLLNKKGNYITLPTKYKNNILCHCNSKIEKSNYLGGNIYYCPKCQKKN